MLLRSFVLFLGESREPVSENSRAYGQRTSDADSISQKSTPICPIPNPYCTLRPSHRFFLSRLLTDSYCVVDILLGEPRLSLGTTLGVTLKRSCQESVKSLHI